MSPDPFPRRPASPEIAALIRAGRLRKGLNQDEVAQQAGVSRTTLHHIERGEIQRPRASTLSRLASVLELDPETLDRAEGDDSRMTTSPEKPRIGSAAIAIPTGFDVATNPVVAELAEAEPQRFEGFSTADWEELASQFGVGGGLTRDGVIAAVDRLRDDRETVAKFRVILQTHLRDSAQKLVEALYETVAVHPGKLPPNVSALHSEINLTEND